MIRFAMAHWGVAMSLWHQLWDQPNAATVKRGRAEVKKAQSLHPGTDRERDYIAALTVFYRKKGDHEERAKAYSLAMEGVYQRYPSDLEAAAFYALSLLASEEDGDTTFANRKKAAAVLETLFKQEPGHPGVAHYLIHSYDKPQLAELGLPAARSYARISPAAPHALHMSSHIFARLGLAGRHRFQPGVHRRHPQDRGHAHGRRGSSISRHGFPGLRLPAERSRGRCPGHHRRGESLAADEGHVRRGL
jgi:hypothetical protein